MRNDDRDLFEIERSLIQKGFAAVAGVDEAGRGPLAGPVFAAAVILNSDDIPKGIDDSKKLSEKKREALFDEIKAKAAAFAICFVSAERIDEINILNATMECMREAVKGLGVKCDYVIVDGNKCPEVDVPCEAVVKGDAKSASIGAASILAKVARDRYMTELSEKYPGYGFEKHKGYGTKSHYAALENLGMCEEHRRTFLKKFLGEKR